MTSDNIKKIDSKLPSMEDIQTLFKQQGGILDRVDRVCEILETFNRQYQKSEVWQGVYRSVEMGIRKDITNHNIDLGIDGRTLLVRTDQKVTVRLNERTSDEITIGPTDNFVAIDGLKPNMTIRQLFVSTKLPFTPGPDVANIKILVFA